MLSIINWRLGELQTGAGLGDEPCAPVESSTLGAEGVRNGKRYLRCVLGCSLAPGLYGEEKVQPWRNLEASPEARAEALLGALSRHQVPAARWQRAGDRARAARLPRRRHVCGASRRSTLPTLRITNGPVGIGQNDCVDAALLTPTMPRIVPYTHPSSAKATALPSAMAIAATFDPQAADRFGQVIAAEAKALAPR